MPFDPYYGNLTDDELLSMGQQAGLLPAPAPDPMQGTLTPPDYAPQSLEGEAVVSPQAPQLSSVGTSYRGIGSDDKWNRIEKKQTGVDAELATASRQAQAGAAPMVQAAESAAMSQAEAAKSQANAQVNKIAAQGREALVLQRVQDEFALEETKANAEANSMSNQAKADYLAALADFRAAKVDPSQLWGNMTGGERFGMLATAFVHDFLGAKGINTSAMATFNKAIDRNIEAQIQGIKTKGEVAEGFKSLWYMQRNQSASDAEARARVRGFLLEGAKQQVIANMSQYESALASAQGQAAVAEIDKELSKTLMDIYKHADQNAIALRNQAIEKWKAKLNAWTEQQALNMRAKELAQRKLEHKKDMNPMAKYLADITPSGGGRLRYEITGAATPDKINEIREQMGMLAYTDNLVGQFQEQMRKVGTLPSGASALMFLQSEEGARLVAMRDALARNLAYAKSGKAVTEEEFKHFQRQFPVDTWLTVGNREKVIADTNERLRNEAFAAIAPFIREVGPDEGVDTPEGRVILRNIQMNPYFNAPGQIPQGVPGDAQAVNNKNIISPPPLSEQERIRKEAADYLKPATAGEDISQDTDLATSPVLNAKKQFLAENPMFSPSGTKSAGAQFSEFVGETPEKAPVTRTDKGLVMLAQLAASGDKQAYDQLKTRAGAYLNSGVRDEEGMFAAFLLNEISESTYEDTDEKTHKKVKHKYGAAQSHQTGE